MIIIFNNKYVLNQNILIVFNAHNDLLLYLLSIVMGRNSNACVTYIKLYNMDTVGMHTIKLLIFAYTYNATYNIIIVTTNGEIDFTIFLVR